MSHDVNEANNRTGGYVSLSRHLTELDLALEKRKQSKEYMTFLEHGMEVLDYILSGVYAKKSESIGVQGLVELRLEKNIEPLTREWKDTEGLEKEVLAVQDIVKRLMEGRPVMEQEVAMAQAFCDKASKTYLTAASWLIKGDREKNMASIGGQCHI